MRQDMTGYSMKDRSMKANKTGSFDEWLFLLGRHPMDENLKYLEASAVEGTLDLKNASKLWLTADTRYKELSRTESGLSDHAMIKELPGTMTTLRDKVLADPIFQKAYSGTKNRIAIVGLDRLVVFQRFMDMTHIGRVIEGIGPSIDAQKVFDVAFPLDHPIPQTTIWDDGNGTYEFLSDSTDLRFLEAQLFDAEQIKGYSPPGPVAGVLGLVMGFGCNFLSVLNYMGRLILNNGSHRALALRKLGIKEAPCIIHDIEDKKAFEIEAKGDLLKHPDQYLEVPRPPLLKDYLDPKLTLSMKAKKRTRLIKVSYNVDLLDLADG